MTRTAPGQAAEDRPGMEADRSLRDQVAANLFDLPAFRRMVRHFVLSPIWILVTLLPSVLLLIGMLAEEFPYPTPVILAIYMARTVIWGAILLLLLPRFARFCMSHNLPFLLAYMGLLLGALIKANILSLAFVPDLTLDVVGLRLLRQATMGLVLTLIQIRFFENEIRGLGSDPALVPVWWPVRPRPTAEAAPAEADIALLDPDLRGRILSLQAQNQYVEVVTPEKTHMLRMPFHQAVAAMPSSAGHRVHRSWWLANDVPVTLVRVGQSWEAQDARGRSYPVSKPNLDLVRALIERNAAEG